ncbi:MAG TPA: hypothetical protein VF519_11030 [Mycobacteriales bacterium]
MLHPHDPPAFPFNSTPTGIAFTAVCTAVGAVVGGLVNGAVSRRAARRDAGEAERREVAAKLRGDVARIEAALGDDTAGRARAVDAAAAAFRETANVELGGPGTERLQAVSTEFVNKLVVLEEQLGPTTPHDPAARSLIDDFLSSLHAYANGWRVPRRLRGRPGVLGWRRRHRGGVPPPEPAAATGSTVRRS